MSSIFKYLLIAVSAAFASGQASIEVQQRCEKRVITQCPCGPGGDLTDVYVDGCLVLSNDSLPCQPCPGSCKLFLNCEKCSKHDCLSCPIGKTGPACELLYSDADSSAENNNSEVEKVDGSGYSTPVKIVEYGFDKPIPNVVALPLNKNQNSSFRTATEDIQPEIKLDMIEFNVGNKSVVELITKNGPHTVKDNSTKTNNTVIDVPKICTKNCSNKVEKQDSIAAAESNKDNKITVPSEDEKFPGGEFHNTLGDPLSQVNGSVDTDSYQIQEFNKLIRKALTKVENNERDRYEVGDSQQQDLSDDQEYAENSPISSNQEAVKESQNKAALQNHGSGPELNRKTAAETKYVYISGSEDNESKYPDAEYESLEQEQVPDEKLFHNNDPSTNTESDPAMDNLEITNEEYSKLLKSGVVDLEKEQPLASLDAIQQLNDQYFENHGNIHKPIPNDLSNSKFSADIPSYFVYFDPKYVMNNVPSFASPNSHMRYGALITNDAPQSFHKNRVPPLLKYLTNMLRMHQTAFGQDRSHLAEGNKVYQSHTLRLDSPKGDRVLTGLQKPISKVALVSLNLEPKSDLPSESVAKGQILIANITNENGTDPGVGSVLSHDFEFKISIPDLEESKYLKKTDRPKYKKGFGRFGKFYTKRRRNGVRNDFSKCDPFVEDCGKITQTHIRRKSNHETKSDTARKGLNNLGYVRVRYVKDDYEPMYDSAEIMESSMSEENMPEEHEYHPHDVDYEMDNFTAEYETESSETSSDPSSSGPRSRRDIESTPFCPIPKDSRNGDMDCTIWSYKKTCTLICHNGYTSPSRYFTCQRSKNTWVPQMVSCKGGPEYEPAEETKVQLRQLEDNDYGNEEEPQPPPRAEEENKDYAAESSSAEMGVRDQSGEEDKDKAPPVKTHAHKKKDHLNKEDEGEKSSGETGARKKAHKKVKEQDEYQKEAEEPHKVHKAHEKDEPQPSEPTQNENEEEWKEETGDEVPKEGDEVPETGSAEEQSAEESPNEEGDEAPNDEEIAQNGVDEEYDE